MNTAKACSERTPGTTSPKLKLGVVDSSDGGRGWITSSLQHISLYTLTHSNTQNLYLDGKNPHIRRHQTASDEGVGKGVCGVKTGPL